MTKTAPVRQKRITIDRFLGVDFANAETEVDTRRSPWAPNMVADKAGYPEKRPGYTCLQSYPGPVHGMGFFQGNMLVHAGTKLYGPEKTILYSDMAERRSAFFHWEDKLYILDGSHYLEYDGVQAKEVDGFIPTTVIGREPSGGGTLFEAVNLLQPKRINSFVSDGTATEFLLDSMGIDTAEVTVWVDGEEKSEGEDYTVDREAGKVIFTQAPADSEGLDSVTIRFSKTVAGYRERICKCTIAGSFGLGSDSRVFLTGNPEYPNTDWQSGLYDPTYFPDPGYTRLGSENTAIMGYLKQYDSMIVVKEQADDETGLFIRSAELTENSEAIFPVKEGIAGMGAVSPYAFGTLAGDPVFLSPGGVYGLDTNAVTQQRSVQLRSFFINPRLTRESSLGEAVGAVWGQFYVACVNGHAYVANGSQTNENPMGGRGYEWYYWTDIPARVLREHDGRLYFGTDDGKVMVFSGEYADDGRAIDAIWTTPLLDGGNFMQEKNISRRGTGILTKPYARSSGEIFFSTEKSLMQVTRKYTMDLMDFDDVDFNRFSFTMQ
ncbi:MAG: hypothetical protein KHW46_05895, partial [Clostridiales bacterium]|nr:hypothetical protein [Clostridiales bacterium]